MKNAILIKMGFMLIILNMACTKMHYYQKKEESSVISSVSIYHHNLSDKGEEYRAQFNVSDGTAMIEFKNKLRHQPQSFILEPWEITKLKEILQSLQIIKTDQNQMCVLSLPLLYEEVTMYSEDLKSDVFIEGLCELEWTWTVEKSSAQTDLIKFITERVHL